MNEGFLITVVMPVYNTERYVRLSIESIVNQTIGFENIELILVNNATEDKSGEICEEYKRKYDNIKYIELKENHGPCGARNAGLRVATGKYINYIDSDDLWECDALEKLYKCIEANRERTDVVIGRLRHFDANENWHILDWRFVDDVNYIDIKEHPECVHLHLGSALIKTEVAKKYEHDEQVYNAEDMHYLNKIIINSGKYILLKEAVYLYRTRPAGDSVLQNVATSKRWYVNTVERVYQYFLDYSKEKWGYVIPYIQYLVMYECQWRLGKPISCSEIDADQYIKSIVQLLDGIDEDVIMAQKTLWYERKLFAIALKRHIIDDPAERRLFYESMYEKNEGLFIKSLIIFNGKIHIKGFVRFPYKCDYRLFIKSMDQKREVIFEGDNTTNDVRSLNHEIAHAKLFYEVVPLEEAQNISFELAFGEELVKQRIKLFRNSKIDRSKIDIDDYSIRIL